MKVYRITTQAINNEMVWDLLTINETPDKDLYFMLENDMPSMACQQEIDEKIENGEWEKLTVNQSGNEIEEWNVYVNGGERVTLTGETKQNGNDTMVEIVYSDGSKSFTNSGNLEA